MLPVKTHKIMKLTFRYILAVLALAAASTVSARNPDEYFVEVPNSIRSTHVSVSYGAAPAMYNIDAFANHWTDLYDRWGTATLSIEHKFADNLWAGLSYTFANASARHAASNAPGNLTWHSLMLNGSYFWASAGRWNFYSHAGIGVLVIYCSPSVADSYNIEHMAFQVSPVGVEYTLGPHAALFAEAGYGVEGIANVGFRIGF